MTTEEKKPVDNPLVGLEIIYKLKDGTEHRNTFHGPDLQINFTKDIRLRKEGPPVFTGWVKAEIIGRTAEVPDEVIKAIDAEFGKPQFATPKPPTL